MNIIDIAIAKQLAGGGGGSGTDSYNDLSNLPKINDVTLSGNKSSSALGLQSEITSDSKLASDLVDDTNQDNKFVTSAEKTTWNGKQNAIDADHKINADYVDDSTSTNKFVTASDKETWNAKQNAIDNSHKLSSDLVDDANHTNKFVTSTEKQTWNAKQNAIDADHKLSSSLVSFSEAEAAAIASGIDSSKVGQISTNQSNIWLLNKYGGGKNYINSNDLDAIKALNTTGWTWNNNVAQKNNVSFTVNKDGTIKVNGTPSALTEFKLPIDHQTEIDGTSVLSTGILDTGDNPIVMRYSGGSYAVPDNYGYVAIPANTVATEIIIQVRTTGTAPSNLLYKPMLCITEDWDASHDYQQYGKPNYDLTRLESEDRASLAEVVDSGAKNIAEIYNVSQNAITITTSGYKATFSGSASQDGSITWGKFHADKTGDYILYYNMSTSAGRFTVYNQTDSEILGSYYPTDNLTPIALRLVAGKNYTVYSWFAAGTASACVIDLMICTKAAFGVSPKFVPYKVDKWSTGQFFCNNSNKSSYTFTVVRSPNTGNRYRYGMFMIGDENTPPSLFSIFIDTTSTVTIAKMTGTITATFTATISWDTTETGTLSITASTTIYGGIRGIWFD